MTIASLVGEKTEDIPGPSTLTQSIQPQQGAPGWLFYVGDEIQPSYMGIIVSLRIPINQPVYKGPPQLFEKDRLDGHGSSTSDPLIFLVCSARMGADFK